MQVQHEYKAEWLRWISVFFFVCLMEIECNGLMEIEILLR